MVASHTTNTVTLYKQDFINAVVDYLIKNDIEVDISKLSVVSSNSSINIQSDPDTTVYLVINLAID